MNDTNFLDKKYQLEILKQCLASYPKLSLIKVEGRTGDKAMKNIIYLIDSDVLLVNVFGNLNREELLHWMQDAIKYRESYIPLTITAKGIDLLTGYSLENNN